MVDLDIAQRLLKAVVSLALGSLELHDALAGTGELIFPFKQSLAELLDLLLPLLDNVLELIGLAAHLENLVTPLVFDLGDLPLVLADPQVQLVVEIEDFLVSLFEIDLRRRVLVAKLVDLLLQVLDVAQSVARLVEFRLELLNFLLSAMPEAQLTSSSFATMRASRPLPMPTLSPRVRSLCIFSSSSWARSASSRSRAISSF